MSVRKQLPDVVSRNVYDFQPTVPPQPTTIPANVAPLNNGELTQSVAFSRTPQGNSDASAEEKITLLGTANTSATAKSDSNTEPTS